MTENEKEASSESNVNKIAKLETKGETSSAQNLRIPRSRDKVKSENLTPQNADITILFINILIVVGVSSVILKLMRIWDWTATIGVPTVLMAFFTYLQTRLKPKPVITLATLIKGLKRNAPSMFLAVAIVFLAASLISLQDSKNDMNKQIIELNSNYNDAISTLSLQQESLSTKQAEIMSRDAQINELQATQVAQSTLVAEFEGIVTQQVAEISSLRGTLEVFNPSPPTKLTTPSITPNTFNLSLIPGRPNNEITFCSRDELHPAGIRVIARWLKDNNTRGFYISVQEGMGISKFRVNGWNYISPTQVNDFPYKKDPSGICGYDAQWLVWADPESIDPTTSTKITIDFLNNDGSVIEQVSFSVE